jgi:hypothetical protein
MYFLVASIPSAPSSHRFTRNPVRTTWLGCRSTLEKHVISDPFQISEPLGGKGLHKSVRGEMTRPRWAHCGYLRDLQRGRRSGVFYLQTQKESGVIATPRF